MPKSRSEVMASIRSRDTSPERALRSALWNEGLRYRLHPRLSAGRPDLVFVGPRVAVFIDGCFWHGCPKHYIFPRTRRDYWLKKLQANVERDFRQTRLLEEDGWRVLRFWEHDVCERLGEVVAEIRDSVCHARPVGTDPNWRLFLVEPHDVDESETRHLRSLSSPDKVQVRNVSRVSRKWRQRLI